MRSRIVQETTKLNAGSATSATTEPVHPHTAPEHEDQRQARRPRWTAGRIASLVIGALLVLMSLAPLGAGGTALWADLTQREGGYVTSDVHEFSTVGSAVTTEPTKIGSAGVLYSPRLLGEIRIRVTSANPSTRPVRRDRTLERRRSLPRRRAPHRRLRLLRGHSGAGRRRFSRNRSRDAELLGCLDRWRRDSDPELGPGERIVASRRDERRRPPRNQRWGGPRSSHAGCAVDRDRLAGRRLRLLRRRGALVRERFPAQPHFYG